MSGQRANRPRTRRAALRLALGGVALLVVVAGAAAFWEAWAAADAMSEARAAVAEAREGLLEGELDVAASHFRLAETRSREAADALTSPTVRALRFIPLARRNLETAQTIAESAAAVAQAGAELASATDGLPGGMHALAPRDGALPIEPLTELAPALQDTADAVAGAADRLAAAPDGLVLPMLADARHDLLGQLEQVRRPALAAAVLADALPGYLGGEEPRRYLFGAQNPAELRGTGGLIGAWAELTAEDGRLSFGEFTTIGTLTLPGDERGSLPSPTEDFERRWGDYAASTHGSNINMSPDFPTVAQALMALHSHQGAPPADGVILADPLLFEALLDLTGPVEIPDVGSLEPGTSVRFLAVEQYAAFSDDSERKPLLGEVAEHTLHRFLTGGAGDDPIKTFSALAGQARRGHLLLHSTDPEEQAAFESAGVAGAFPTETPVAATVLNNAAANKLDYFLERKLELELYLEPDGAAWMTMDLFLENAAPRGGFARTVLGPNTPGLSAGEHRLHVSAYCGNCELQQLSRNGDLTGAIIDEEFGHVTATTWESLDSGESRELRFVWRVEDVWSPASGELRLLVPGQPSYRPPEFSVTVHAPEGHLVGWHPHAADEPVVSASEVLEANAEVRAHVRRTWSLGSAAHQAWNRLSRRS